MTRKVISKIEKKKIYLKTSQVVKMIKEYFFLNPTRKLRVRQIEKELGLSLPSVIEHTNKLVEKEILKIIQIENITFYQANLTSQRYLLEKKMFNLKQIYESNLIIFLKEKYSNPTIILFGSYALGEDIETSDIDMYIQSPIGDIEIPLQYENELQRTIHIFVFKDITKIRNKELANNIINGTILNGYLEVFK